MSARSGRVGNSLEARAGLAGLALWQSWGTGEPCEFAGSAQGLGSGRSESPGLERTQLRLWRTRAAVPRAQPVVATTAMTATVAPRAMVMYQAGWAAS